MICVFSTSVISREASIESIIDQLEKKITEESGDRLNIYNAKTKTHKKQIEINESFIVDPKLQEFDSLEKLENELKQVEDQLSRLSDDVAATVQKILARSEEDTRVFLELDSSKLTNYNLKKMYVTLNGHELFEYDSSREVTLPLKKIALYDGPLVNGKHGLQLTASFNKKNNGEVSIESESYSTLNQKIDVIIDRKDSDTKFTIEISPDEPKGMTTKLNKSTIKFQKSRTQRKD